MKCPKRPPSAFRPCRQKERDALAVAAIEEPLNRLSDEEADLIAAVNEGLGDVRLGRTIPFEEIEAQLDARFGK